MTINVRKFLFRFSVPLLVIVLMGCQSHNPQKKFSSLQSLVDPTTGNYQKQTQDVLDEFATRIDQIINSDTKSYLIGEYAKLAYISEDWDRLFGIFYVCSQCSPVAERIHSLALLKFCNIKNAKIVTQSLVEKKDKYGMALNSLADLSKKYLPPQPHKLDSAKSEGSRVRKWPLLGTTKAPFRFIRARTQNLCENQKVAVDL